nr:hypothetical protein [Tanacetum cinerariifolium]
TLMTAESCKTIQIHLASARNNNSGSYRANALHRNAI